MPRCGRCGLWNAYPQNHPEKVYAGVCVWYQIRLHPTDVYESRDCPDFLERIPNVTALEHMNYKIQRDNLGDAYQAARFSKRLALLGMGISVVSFAMSLWESFGE